MASKRQVLAELTASHAELVKARAERERANLVDAAEFVTQRAKEDEVAGWLESAVKRLEVEAALKRGRCQTAAGVAAAAMIERGTSLREVAELVGIPAAKVQEYVSAARGAGRPAERPNGVEVGSNLYAQTEAQAGAVARFIETGE